MAWFGDSLRYFEKHHIENNILQQYQKTMLNSVLDELSIYVSYRNNSKIIGYTIKELDEYTPDWVLAKYHLISKED